MIRIAGQPNVDAARRAKRADPFYLSDEWKRLRLDCLRRDGFACVKCGARANVADHIVSRRQGGKDDLANLRSLCAICDNRMKENADGRRRNSGSAGVIGADGFPT